MHAKGCKTRTVNGQKSLARGWALPSVIFTSAVTFQIGCNSTASSDVKAHRIARLDEFSSPVPRGEAKPDAPSSNEVGLGVATTIADTSRSPVASSAPESLPTSPGASASVPSPDRGAVASSRIGQETVVESVVGQVSGRPIFADEFLEPLEDQLRSEAERLNQDEFITRARRIITDRLQQVVINELFLAEAEAALTPQQQMGLLAFLKDLQEKNVAEAGGTIFGAQRQIEEQQEMSLEDFEEAQRNETLIRNLIFERISPRVIVAWRDVQREYELRRVEFNPPAVVTIKRLRLDAQEQKELVDQVKVRLAGGATLEQVVEELALSEFAGLVGADGRFTFTGDDLSTIGVADALKEALQSVPPEVGRTTDAIQSGDSVQWLTVAAIDRPEPKTLFDVQEQLIAELQARRFNEEYRKYIDGLFQKGIFDELETMGRRLLAVAILRYAR